MSELVVRRRKVFVRNRPLLRLAPTFSNPAGARLRRPRRADPGSFTARKGHKVSLYQESSSTRRITLSAAAVSRIISHSQCDRLQPVTFCGFWLKTVKIAFFEAGKCAFLSLPTRPSKAFICCLPSPFAPDRLSPFESTGANPLSVTLGEVVLVASSPRRPLGPKFTSDLS